MRISAASRYRSATPCGRRWPPIWPPRSRRAWRRPRTACSSAACSPPCRRRSTSSRSPYALGARAAPAAGGLWRGSPWVAGCPGTGAQGSRRSPARAGNVGPADPPGTSLGRVRTLSIEEGISNGSVPTGGAWPVRARRVLMEGLLEEQVTARFERFLEPPRFVGVDERIVEQAKLERHRQQAACGGVGPCLVQPARAHQVDDHLGTRLAAGPVHPRIPRAPAGACSPPEG